MLKLADGISQLRLTYGAGTMGIAAHMPDGTRAQLLLTDSGIRYRRYDGTSWADVWSIAP